jgi:hypothetical protein
VTSVAAGLAALWPRPGAVVVEADPAGGDLAARFGLYQEPSLAGVAAAIRHGQHDGGLSRFVQRLPLGAQLVVGPVGAQAAATVAALATGRGPEVLVAAGQRGPVIVDVGRLQGGSPALPLVRAAQTLLLVARPWLDALDTLDAWRPHLLRLARRGDVRLVLVGAGQFRGGAVGRDIGMRVAGQLPTDRRGAGVLAGRLTASRGWSRLPLPRALRALAVDLDEDPTLTWPPPPLAIASTPGAQPGDLPATRWGVVS